MSSEQLALLSVVMTIGPGAAMFLFTRWLRQKDQAEVEAKKEKEQAEVEVKRAEAEKLDQVLGIAKRLEGDMHGLSQRLATSDAMQNQLKGTQEKIEERGNGISATYGRRLGDLEAKIERLDERTRLEPRRRR